MSQAPNVGRVQNRKQRKAVGTPGQLDRYDDGSWEYFGNDQTSADEVAANIIRFERDKGNEEYKQLQSQALAQLLLDGPDNKKLRDKLAGNVKQPIPRTMSFVAEAPTLKSCVQLLLKHAEQLRQSLLVHNQRGANDKTLGTVPSAGLSLPYEPS